MVTSHRSSAQDQQHRDGEAQAILVVSGVESFVEVPVARSAGRPRRARGGCRAPCGLAVGGIELALHLGVGEPDLTVGDEAESDTPV